MCWLKGTKKGEQHYFSWRAKIRRGLRYTDFESIKMSENCININEAKKKQHSSIISTEGHKYKGQCRVPPLHWYLAEQTGRCAYGKSKYGKWFIQQWKKFCCRLTSFFSSYFFCKTLIPFFSIFPTSISASVVCPKYKREPPNLFKVK